MRGRNLRPVTSGSPSGAESVLISGVYGSGKSSVAAEIAYLLEQRRQPYAFLDVDFLGWGGADFSGHSAGRWLTLRNLASVVANYREAGVGLFVLAYFIPGRGGAVAGGPADRAAAGDPAATGQRRDQRPPG